MLIEFRVQNFLSIREPQVLSMLANKRDKELPGNLIHLSLPGLGEVDLLKSLVLYGPNASGKSNIIRAVRFMDSFVEDSAVRMKPDAPIAITPFLLDADSRNKPSEFEANFVQEGVRYQYGFSVTPARVEAEWLYAFPEGRSRKLFVREFDDQKGEYRFEFGTHFREDPELQKRTRPNALFLSTGAQFNHPDLLSVYQWFGQQLRILDLAATSKELLPTRTAEIVLEAPDLTEVVVALLRKADTGITDVSVEADDEPPDVFDMMEWMDRPAYRVRFHHAAEGIQGVEFDYAMESAGTQRFFSLIAPILEMLFGPRCTLVDEMGASLHTLLSRQILTLINSDSNSKGAQLIFTTHDVTLLDSEVFRRDQVWFVEKNSSGSTEIYALTTYKPRKNEALQKGYLAGRYGAIPYFTGDMRLVWEEHARHESQ